MTGLRVGTHSTARLRRWSMLTSVALVLTAAGLLAHPASVLAWDGNSFSAADEQELVTLTNQARASAGLRAMRPLRPPASSAIGGSRPKLMFIGWKVLASAPAVI